MKSRLRGQGLMLWGIIALSFLPACRTVPPVSSTAEIEEAPGKTLVGYMADLGQAMNRFYRVHGVAKFREEELRLAHEMVIIQQNCLDLLPDTLADEPNTVDERTQLYRFFALRSLRLLEELLAAVRESDSVAVERILLEIDQNRRNAHSEFG